MKLGTCFVCEKWKMIHCREACQKCYQRLAHSGKLDTHPKPGQRKSIPRVRTGNVTTQ